MADAIRANVDAVLGFLDEGLAAAELVAGAPVLGPLSLALGNPSLRQTLQQVLERQAAPVGVLVHPFACVSPSAQLAPGCRESRFAELQLAPGATNLNEGVSCAGSSR